jgi:hypothetical protein
MNPSSPEINQPPIQSPEIIIPKVDTNLPVPENEDTRESLDEEIADLKRLESTEGLNDSTISSQNVSNFNRISQPGVKVKLTNPDSDLANRYLHQISK